MAGYGKKSRRKVKRAMHEYKRGKLKSGKSGAKAKSRKQAIAIGLSEARREGGKVPKRKSGAKKSASRRKASSKPRRKSSTRKSSTRKSSGRRSSSRKKSASRKKRSRKS